MFFCKPYVAGWAGHYINVRRCGVLSMVLLQLKDPLELFMRSFLSRRNVTLAVENDIKTNSFLPSFYC